MLNILKRTYLHFLPWLWKIAVFRGNFSENKNWEKNLLKKGIYRNTNFILFGDSQIALWRMKTSFGKLPLKNRGKNSDLASLAIKRFSKEILKYHPTAVIILIGTNDLAQKRGNINILKDLEQMSQLSQEEKITPFLCSILPVNGRPQETRSNTEIKSLNNLIKNYCQKKSLSYIDFWRELVDEEEKFNKLLTFDGLHPNTRGYQIMTTLLKKTLSEKKLLQFPS